VAHEPLVLVVDDYADAREMYAAWLEVSGYRVSQAGTVTDALSLAVDHLPDAILMDLSMPGIDGLEATRRLKADPRTRHIPILAMTGHVEARVADDAVAAGCDGLIVKPSPAPDVVHALGRLITRAGGQPPPDPT
jgi:two-component system, cell cycle response regulator DivK